MIEVQTDSATRYEPCCKCGRTRKKSGYFLAAGGFLPSFFDLATEKFICESFVKRGFTEFYKSRIGAGNRMPDFIGS